VKGNYSQELKDLILLMLSQDPSVRPSAHALLYTHIPALLKQFEEETTTEQEEEPETARDKLDHKKKTRLAI